MQGANILNCYRELLIFFLLCQNASQEKTKEKIRKCTFHQKLNQFPFSENLVHLHRLGIQLHFKMTHCIDDSAEIVINSTCIASHESLMKRVTKGPFGETLAKCKANEVKQIS